MQAKHRRLAIPIVCLLLLSLGSGAAWACGESMFRIGKGVHYRAYSAPIPGTVLVYARTDEERAVAEALRAAGHEVLVVESDLELGIELSQHKVDVIVAPASKRTLVEGSVEGLATSPDWVPVHVDGELAAGGTASPLPAGVDSDDDIRKYLKAIHKSMKNRGV